MSRRGAVAWVVAALVVGSVAPAAPVGAEAVPVPGPVVTLSTDGLGPTTVVDGRGNATAVWSTDWWQGPVLAARRPAGGSWSTPVTIGRGTDPLVGVDSAGTVTVVFATNRPGLTTGLAAVRHSPGRPWTRPVRLSRERPAHAYDGDDEGTFGAHRTDLAVSPAGDVVVAWQWGSYDRDKPFRIEVARRPHGRPWSPLVPLTTRDWSSDPEIGIDRGGRASLVYQHRGSLVSRWFAPGVGWAAAVRLVPSEAVLDYDVAVAPAGNTTVMLHDYRNHRARVTVLRRPPAGPWSKPHRVSPRGVYCFWAGIVVDGPSSVTVVWKRRSGRVDQIRWSGGRWSSPAVVASDIDYYEPALAANRSGDVVVWWETPGRSIRARVRDGTGAWTPRFTLWPGPATGYYDGVQAALYPNGDLLSAVQRGHAVRVRRVSVG